jgi:hypothetical protein
VGIAFQVGQGIDESISIMLLVGTVDPVFTSDIQRPRQKPGDHGQEDQLGVMVLSGQTAAV